MINNPPIISANQTSPASFYKCTNKVTLLAANTPVLIAKGNSKRGYGVFVNNSDSLITLILGEIDKGDIDEGIPLNPGGSFEITLINLYKGAISAISSSAAKISWVECE